MGGHICIMSADVSGSRRGPPWPLRGRILGSVMALAMPCEGEFREIVTVSFRVDQTVFEDSAQALS